MRQSHTVWFVAGGAIFLVGHRLIGYYRLLETEPNPIGRWIRHEFAVVGTVLLIVGALLWLMDKARKFTHEPPARLFFRGALFGLIAGGIIAALIKAEDATDFYTTFERVQRELVFAGLIGGSIYFMLHLVADSSSTRTVSRLDQVLAMATGFLAVFVSGVWIAMDLSRLVSALCRSTLGLLDHFGYSTDSCSWKVLDARPDIPTVAAGMLGIYFFLVACFESNRWRLSFARSIIIIGGTLVAGFAIYGVVELLHGEKGILHDPGKFAKFGPFLVAMGLYAALFSFWVTWSNHHSLVEALSDAFGSTGAFRSMLDSRLKSGYDVPKRLGGLYTDVRSVVDQAESNGWIGPLLVHARRSKPANLRLARIADRMGLGIDTAEPENLRKAVIAVTGDPNAARDLTPTQLASKLESVIRKFSEIEPEDRRMMEAKLEARVCRVVTKLNTGTGWLIGPDLVLTNYHVIKEMLEGSNPTKGSQVKCQFDYRMAKGAMVKGVKGIEITLDDDKPVVAYRPYSQADTSTSETALPNEDELDFALLRLRERIGEKPVGGEGEDGAPVRGWISLKGLIDAPDLIEDNAVDRKPLLYVLQHPDGKPLKAEVGVVMAINANKTRIRHEASTAGGSSGSPCFDYATLQPVALHHAGRHSGTLNLDYNQAVPLPRILRYLRDEYGISNWDQSPDELPKRDLKKAAQKGPPVAPAQPTPKTTTTSQLKPQPAAAAGGGQKFESRLIDGQLTPAEYFLFASRPLTVTEIREAHETHGRLLVGFDSGGVPREGPITNEDIRDGITYARSIDAELEIYVEGPGGPTGGDDWLPDEVVRVGQAARRVNINIDRDGWMQRDWDTWGWKTYTFAQLATYREMGFNAGEIDNLDRVLKTTNALVEFYKEYAEKQLAGDLPQLVMKNIPPDSMRAVVAAIQSNQLPRSAFSDFHIFECGKTEEWKPVDKISSIVGIRTVPSRVTERYDAKGDFGKQDAFKAAIRNEQGGAPVS